MIRVLHYGKGLFQKKMAMPTEWNDLTRKQLFKAALLVHGGWPENIARQKSVHVLSARNILSFLSLPKDFRVRAEIYAEWLLKGDSELTRQILPMYKGLYGPESSFDNLLMVEFHYSEMAYYNLQQTKDPVHLDELIAILYREGKKNYNHSRNPDGDHRTTFTYGDIAWHQKKVTGWPNEAKLAILLWYDGCREQLVRSYPDIYANAKGKSSNYFDGLYKMIRSVAGEKYGTIDRVELLGVHTMHLEMSCMLEDYRQLTAKNGNHE